MKHSIARKFLGLGLAAACLVGCGKGVSYARDGYAKFKDVVEKEAGEEKAKNFEYLWCWYVYVESINFSDQFKEEAPGLYEKAEKLLAVYPDPTNLVFYKIEIQDNAKSDEDPSKKQWFFPIYNVKTEELTIKTGEKDNEPYEWAVELMETGDAYDCIEGGFGQLKHS